MRGKDMSETIFRVEKDANNPFVMIDKRIFENEKLSYKAKGILGYLLSRPNDWVVMAVDIKNRSTDGKDSVASGIQELIEHGYIVKTEQPRQAGKFATCDYVVYECPINTESNRSGKTDTDKPQRKNRNGKTAATNTDNTKKENTNTLNVSFDDFWNLYDKKVGDKEKIKTKWVKLKDSEREAIMNHLPLYKKSQPNKKYRKDPSTYLNNKSWNDEIIFDDGQQPVSHDYTEQVAAPVFDEVVLKTDPKVLAMIAAKRKGGSHGTA